MNKMSNELSVNHRPSTSGLTSRIHRHIFLDILMFYLCTEILVNFLSDLYIPPWLGKFFQICGGQITGKCICESKNWKWTFLLMPYPKVKLYSRLLYPPPSPFPPSPLPEGIYSFPPGNVFLFENVSPSRKDGRRRFVFLQK